MHTIPEDGFLVNKAFVNIIENYIRLDPVKNKIKKSFDKLSQSIMIMKIWIKMFTFLIILTI